VLVPKENFSSQSAQLSAVFLSGVTPCRKENLCLDELEPTVLQAGRLSCRQTNSVKALKATQTADAGKIHAGIILSGLTH